MSAIIGSRSANRGCCGQACRLPFSACGNKNAAALSLKDLSLLPVISQVQEIGVDSLKIEGRMKRPEYVSSAVDALKKALNGEAPDMQTLRGVFSRGGFTDGYFTGKRSNMFGVREKEDVAASASLFPKIHELYRSERKIRTVSFHAVIKSGLPVKIEAVCGNFRESVSAEPPETAMNRPTDMEMLEKQLSRLGDTVFEAGEITAEIDSGLIVPAGKLNQLRRELIDKLSKRIISETKPTYTITDYQPVPPKKSASVHSERLPLRIFCRTPGQVEAAAKYSDFVIVPHKLLLNEDTFSIDKNRVIVSPPRFIANEEKTSDELQMLRNAGFSRLMCDTLDSAAMGKKLGYTLHGGFGLNIFNSFSAQVLEKLGFADFTVSFEAKISQINRISSAIPFGAIVCGRLPLMLTRNCPIKNEVGCAKCSGHITDRTGRSFPVSCSGDYVEILNSDTLFMLDKPELLSAISFGTVILSEDDSPENLHTVLHEKPSGIITRGLYYRGI
jgi:putative protease